MGLYHDDTEWDKVMEEASIWGFPKSLRMLAANILLYNRPVDPMTFIANHVESLTEDFRRKNEKAGQSEIHDWLFSELKQLLEAAGSGLKPVGLPEPERVKKTTRAFSHEYNWDLTLLRDEQDNILGKLTEQQTVIFDAITESIKSSDGQTFFIDAPGGSGKSFTAHCIMNHVRLSNSMVLDCTSSGIAATVTKNSSFQLISMQIQNVMLERAHLDTSS